MCDYKRLYPSLCCQRCGKPVELSGLDYDKTRQTTVCPTGHTVTRRWQRTRWSTWEVSDGNSR